MKPLPELSSTPAQYSDCCCSLSLCLVSTIADVIQSAGLSIVSIGSGTGLLEAYLLREKPDLSLKAIEVSHAINIYLPCELVETVLGTWDVSTAAAGAQCWLFVYPRNQELFRTYVYSPMSKSLNTILWIGPRLDAEEYLEVPEDQDWTRKIHDNCGLGPYELLISWTRNIHCPKIAT